MRFGPESIDAAEMTPGTVPNCAVKSRGPRSLTISTLLDEETKRVTTTGTLQEADDICCARTWVVVRHPQAKRHSSSRDALIGVDVTPGSDFLIVAEKSGFR